VKPSNILLSRAGAVKLGDLGICSSPSATGGLGRTGSAAAQETAAATQWIGTVTYMSPERILGDAYSFNADVWSLGVVLAEAGLCRYPYAPSTAQHHGGAGGAGPGAGRSLQFWDLLDLVVAGPCPSDALAAHLAAAGEARAQEAAAFVRECLARDLQGRPGARRCLAHPFLDADAAAAAAGRAALVKWLAAVPPAGGGGGAEEAGCVATPSAAAPAAAVRAPSPPRTAAGPEKLFAGLLAVFGAGPAGA
jgi:serine/threonine protein kinase